MPNESTPPVRRDMSAFYTPGAIIVAGVLVAGGLYFGLSAGKSGQVAAAGDGQQQQQAVNVKDVKTDGEPFIGDKNAPVTMAFWSDYQCPYCKAVEVGHPQIQVEPSMPTLIKDYVDTGKLRIVFKDYAFLGNDSITGAEYGRAVWDLYPDKFYTWRKAMFEAQDAEGDTGFGNETTILALIAKIPGMDANKVKAQVAAHKADYDKAIQADRDEGTKFGVQGTPGFIIGTQFIGGAQPYASFKSAIDSQL